MKKNNNQSACIHGGAFVFVESESVFYATIKPKVTPS